MYVVNLAPSMVNEVNVKDESFQESDSRRLVLSKYIKYSCLYCIYVNTPF